MAQHLQGLAHGLPADAELCRQLPFAGEPFAGRGGSLTQLPQEFGGDPPIERLLVCVGMFRSGGAGHVRASW